MRSWQAFTVGQPFDMNNNTSSLLSWKEERE
jgi:hypothetical protein